MHSNIDLLGILIPIMNIMNIIKPMAINITARELKLFSSINIKTPPAITAKPLSPKIESRNKNIQEQQGQQQHIFFLLFYYFYNLLFII
jgi:hypothetical protein